MSFMSCLLLKGNPHVFYSYYINISSLFFHRSTILYMDYTCTCIHFKILFYRKSLIIPLCLFYTQGLGGDISARNYRLNMFQPPKHGGFLKMFNFCHGVCQFVGSTFIPYGSKHEKVRLPPNQTPKTS